MGRRLMVILAWVLSTTLAATVAWAAVGAVGRGPGSTNDAVLSQSDVAAALAARQAASASASATASPTASPGDPTPSATPTSATSPMPTANPTPSHTPTGVPPTEVARTWAVDGGTVSATCRDAAISLAYATPTDGWGVEIKARGPEALEVEFDSEAGETTVRAQCVAGVPQMTATAGTAGDRDEGD